MIAIRHKDAAQNGYEASIRCLQNKSQPFTLPKTEKPPELQTKFHDQLVLDPKHLSCTEILESSEECTQYVIYNHDSAPWFANPDVNYVPQWILHPLHGQVQPFPVNYPIQYAPSNMFPSVYPYEYQLQDFQFFVVIDFEATCDRGKIPNPQEIIEFPSVIVSSISGQLEACFQTYVRPTCNQVLSDFCKELTGIQQIQVDRGVTLSEALLRHDKWLEKRGIKNANFAVVTWSDWDCQVMLESECRYKNIRKPTYFNRWINLRVPFQQVFGGTRCNLKEAVEMAGLTWQGRAHCGLDDAKNTAHLLALLMHRGFKFSITSSLTSPYNNDGSFTKWKPTPETPPYTPSQPQKHAEFQVPHPHHYCYCGVKSSKGMVKKPGPKQGSVFFGCGNWTVNRGARCQYFEWASQ